MVILIDYPVFYLTLFSFFSDQHYLLVVLIPKQAVISEFMS